jgi:hypothetical protein
MIVTRRNESKENGKIVIQFNLAGLIAFSVSLVFAAGLLAYVLTPGKSSESSQAAASSSGVTGDPAPADVPPWGELMISSIELEPPEEYLGFELAKEWTPAWIFEGKSADEARAVMVESGLTPEQLQLAVGAGITEVSGGVSLTPPDDLILSLAPEVRSRLYIALSRGTANQFIRFPFRFTEESFNLAFADARVDEATVARTRKLLYPRGDALCFSDYEWMLRQIPSEAERLRWIKVMSRQTAVLTRLRIRPETDIDKILGYWGRGIQVKDVRPLLESLKRRADGGNVSLLYLLPPFARQRLYTFPYDSLTGDPVMDCHWSTMNFFNDPPDDRFSNPAFTAEHIRNNLYGIAKPTLYGDIILFLDDRNQAVHSAVYLAEDIVFTKNGNNAAQPWMAMRLQDLIAKYEPDRPSRVAVYRSKSRN